MEGPHTGDWGETKALGQQVNQRQKVLLSLLIKSAGKPTKLKLMKWLFLLKQETCLASDNSFYDFVPYKYGPFSFVVYRDLDELTSSGYLSPGKLELMDTQNKLVRHIDETLPFRLQEAIAIIVRKYGKLSKNNLMSYVYEKYSWYASRSEKTPDTRKKRRAKRAIYTAGYEGESIDGFLQKLLKARLECIIDVRCNAISRKYGFSKTTLTRLSENLDISYTHIPQVGIPAAFRSELKIPSDYRKLLKKYERTILPKVQHWREEAGRIICERPSVLVCFEADAKLCHRSCLAEAISIDTGLPVKHL